MAPQVGEVVDICHLHLQKYCIRKFAEHFGITVKESFDYLHKYKGIKFLDDCYEAEHTLSFDDAMDDLTAVCLKHGGYLS